jgi:hypothetical protein
MLMLDGRLWTAPEAGQDHLVRLPLRHDASGILAGESPNKSQN